MLFNVPASWKWACFKSAGSKWRQFKSKLSKKFVYDKLDSDDSEDLNTVPAGYPNISASDWSTFVISRLADNFKVT